MQDDALFPAEFAMVDYLQQHSDCTHVCSSPFLWEPAWEGLLASSAATRAPR